MWKIIKQGGYNNQPSIYTEPVTRKVLLGLDNKLRRCKQVYYLHKFQTTENEYNLSQEVDKVRAFFKLFLIEVCLP